MLLLTYEWIYRNLDDLSLEIRHASNDWMNFTIEVALTESFQMIEWE